MKTPRQNPSESTSSPRVQARRPDPPKTKGASRALDRLPALGRSARSFAPPRSVRSESAVLLPRAAGDLEGAISVARDPQPAQRRRESRPPRLRLRRGCTSRRENLPVTGLAWPGFL